MKCYILTMLVMIIVFTSFAQPPQGFKYQAVVRDNTGEIIQNQAVGIQISIHDATAGGTIIYQETFNQTTNQFGLVNLEIGSGTPTIGTFASIEWSSNSKFFETEIDQEGGSNYVSVGTSELLSVPYALYSERSMDAAWEKSGNEIFYNDGNVGIGTSDPAGSLDVRGAGTDEGVVINLGNSDLSHKRTLFGGKESDPNPFLLWKDGDPFRFATDAGGFEEKMRITSSGNVGIGISNPSDKLDISGTDAGLTVRHDSAYHTVYGQIKHGNSEGMILNANAGSGGWADMRFQTNGDTKMFLESAGKFGIGTTEPIAGLHLKGSGYPNSFMFLQSDTNSDAGLRFYEGDTVKWHIFNKSSANALYIYNSNNTKNVFCAEQSSGNVGIGTITPDARLHVNDRIRVGEDLTASTVYGELIHEGGGTGFKINANAGGGSWADMHFQTNGTTKMFIESNGNVGIGTTSPTAALDVYGHISVTGSGQSVFIGEGAGVNDDLSNNSNVFIGYQSGNSNTTGHHNIAIGKNAGDAKSADSYCTYVGYNTDNTWYTSITNSMALGFNTTIYASNLVRVGNSSVSSIGGFVGWTNFSDQRFKKNISRNVPGLDFILKLQPVTYNLDVDKIDTFLGIHDTILSNERLRKGRIEKATMTQTGLIAQEVEAAAESLGYDFSGVDPPKNEHDFYGLRYAEFVVPLIKSIQEQQKIIEELKLRIEELESK